MTFGSACVTRDIDFSARELDMEIASIASFPWQTAELMHSEITKHPERRMDERWLNYYSPRPFATISYSEALTNTASPSGLSFSNKVVFIGETQVVGFVGEVKEE